MMHDLARYFRIAQLALAACLLGAPAMAAQPPQWHYHVTKYGMRQAFIKQKATGLGEHCSARLNFWVTQDLGKDWKGSLGLDLTVSPVHPCSFKGFDFDHFVDENGAGKVVQANNQPFIRVTIFEDSKRFVLNFGVYGLYEYKSDPHTGFQYTGMTFETNDLIDNKQSAIRKLVDHLLKGADDMEIDVIDGKSHATIFTVTFPVAGSRPMLAQMLKGL